MATEKETKKTENAKENVTKEMKESPLHKFFLDGLKDMLYAEKALIKALDKMYESATTEELKDAFEEHKMQTQNHYSRLEKVFKLLGETPEEKTCKAMDGLLKEADEIIASTENGSMTRDAALIIAAQKVEHYEIASYGGLAQLAITMKHRKVADILEKILQEEEDTDLLLTEIAETSINMEAEEEKEEK
jgi:ferritin-like metal-binding protein YciE